MRAKQTLFILPLTLLLCFVLMGPDAGARVSGQLVEPDVMLVIDSSGSMDWLPTTPTGTDEWRYAREQCLEDDPTNERSPWQTLQDALIGSIHPNEYHCTVEAPPARPGLHGGVDKTNPDWYVPDNTAEFRISNPHFRAVSCPDGMWQPGVNELASVIKAANADLSMYQRVVGWRFWPARDFPRTHTMKIKRNPVREWAGSDAALQVRETE